MRLQRLKPGPGGPRMSWKVHWILPSVQWEAREVRHLIFIYKVKLGCEENKQEENMVGEEWTKELVNSYCKSRSNRGRGNASPPMLPEYFFL